MKKFVKQFLGAVIVILLAVMGYNYMTDTSGLFNKDFSIPRPATNEHFVKIRYLLKNPDKYNAYCFGSSRVGNIDLKQIHNGNIYYNMTYSEGLPQEWAQDIKIMMKHHVQIAQIMLGVDDFSFRVNPKIHEMQYLRIPYHENNLKTYLSFLLKKPTEPVKNDENYSVYDIFDSGRVLHEQAEEKIEQNVQAHINDPKFLGDSHYSGNYITETIAAIKEIKDITDKNGVELIVFINPIYQTTYLANNMEEFNEFKYELGQVTDYYDFSGLNKITMNSYNYYETNHYRPLVGNKMLKRIFDESKYSDDSFGIYVTKDTVESHIKDLQLKYQNSLPY